MLRSSAPSCGPAYPAPRWTKTGPRYSCGGKNPMVSSASSRGVKWPAGGRWSGDSRSSCSHSCRHSSTAPSKRHAAPIRRKGMADARRCAAAQTAVPSRASHAAGGAGHIIFGAVCQYLKLFRKVHFCPPPEKGYKKQPAAYPKPKAQIALQQPGQPRAAFFKRYFCFAIQSPDSGTPA